jgi:hypothetical protein
MLRVISTLLVYSAVASGFLFGFPKAAIADHGGCPCATTPASQSSLAPTDLLVEPFQRAIIAWNGEIEILILATDMAVSTNKLGFSRAVQFIPLPANATSQQERREVFDRMNALYPMLSNLRSARPSNAIGTMDVNSEVVEIAEPSELIAAITRRCAIEPSYIAPAQEIAQQYIDRGYRAFAIESIALDSTVRSFPPMSYEFPSAELYYPLETSVMGSGITSVDLTLVTPNGIDNFDETSTPITMLSRFSIDASELINMQPRLVELFSQDKVVVQRILLRGDLKDMKLDLRGR